jgi:hypothetical protein
VEDWKMKIRMKPAAAAALGAIAMSAAGLARADGLDPVKGAFGETKPIIDMRLRAENVDQDGIANDAHATTLRLRAGFETGKAWNTALLIEGEGIVPIQTDYRPDPMVPTMTTYPVVADAEPAGHHAHAGPSTRRAG